jgi:hypothetical protein
MNKVPMILALRYSKDFPNGSSFFRTLLSSESIGNGSNFFLVGATPEQLAGWGYSVTSVPSVDAKIDECLPKFGLGQATCWAELDQLVMEQIVPYVPYLFGASATIASSSVLHLTYDQFADLTALDQIALTPG